MVRGGARTGRAGAGRHLPAKKGGAMTDKIGCPPQVTGEERREVAARLRKERERMDAERPPLVPIIAAAEYLLRISRIVLRDEDSGRLFNRLADLIDPTCVMTPQGDGFRCSSCGTYHDMSGFDEFPWPRCPECGARVVGADD